MTRISLMLAMMCAVSAYADTSLRWTELPVALKGKNVVVTTKNGQVHRGRFVTVTDDALVVKESEKVEIPRSAILSLSREVRFHFHWARFEDGIGAAIEIELFGLASPYLPIAVAALPVTGVVWAGGAPVCAIFDLFDPHWRNDEILLPEAQVSR